MRILAFGHHGPDPHKWGSGRATLCRSWFPKTRHPRGVAVFDSYSGHIGELPSSVVVSCHAEVVSQGELSVGVYIGYVGI